MAFLKALTVFLLCISIFKVVVPYYKTCGVQSKPSCNVLLRGTAKCPSCEYYTGSVKIGLEEGTMLEHIDVKCNDNFHVEKHLEDPHPEVYKANFSFYCGSQPMKSVYDKNPLFLNKTGEFYVYEFGIIDFTKL
uniref:Uncharacterized protein n=1 Tax=Strongyloides papillosus TaxID=174720 RepID=A0A0N5BMT5_STREA